MLSRNNAVKTPATNAGAGPLWADVRDVIGWVVAMVFFYGKLAGRKGATHHESTEWGRCVDAYGAVIYSTRGWLTGWASFTEKGI